MCWSEIVGKCSAAGISSAMSPVPAAATAFPATVATDPEVALATSPPPQVAQLGPGCSDQIVQRADQCNCVDRTSAMSSSASSSNVSRQ